MIRAPPPLMGEIRLEVAEVVAIQLDLAALESVPGPVRGGRGDAMVDPAWGDGVGKLIVEDCAEGGEDLDGGRERMGVSWWGNTGRLGRVGWGRVEVEKGRDAVHDRYCRFGKARFTEIGLEEMKSKLREERHFLHRLHQCRILGLGEDFGVASMI
jgi:hypothetical protein